MCVWWKHVDFGYDPTNPWWIFSSTLLQDTLKNTVTKQRGINHQAGAIERSRRMPSLPIPVFLFFPLRDMKWNYHLFPFPSSQPSFVPRSPLQLILIFYMFEFTKKSFMLETHTMPFSPPGCDCTCGIGRFSLVYCGVTFVLCGMVLQ